MFLAKRNFYFQKRNVFSLSKTLTAVWKGANNKQKIALAQVAMQALLRQVNECRGAMSMHEIVTDQLRAELKEREEAMDLMSQVTWK